MNKTTPLALALALLVTPFLGCNGPGDDVADCDYLIFPSTADSDEIDVIAIVDLEDAITGSFTVEVEFAAISGGAGGVEPPTVNDNFAFSHYIVTYRNLRTGGTVAGVDVPSPMQQSLFTFTQRVPASFNFDNFPVLREGALSEAPLNNSLFFAGGPVPFIATITFFGHPVTDPGKVCTGTMTYGFDVIDL